MNEQMEMKLRTRNEEGFRNRPSRDGIISCKFDLDVSKRIIDYCKSKNLNKTKFINNCMRTQLDELEQEYYESLDKDELIRLLRNKKG